MKVTLQRTVYSNVDILLDKRLGNAENAESFFLQVASNLVQKGFKNIDKRSINGCQFWKFVQNNKPYILSLY